MKRETTPQLLMRPDEAAKALAISTRKLWALTRSGQLACLRIGRAVRYDPRDLVAWIDRQKQMASASCEHETAAVNET